MPKGPFLRDYTGMDGQESSAEILREWKAEEARERMLLAARGETGAIQWPADLVIIPSKSPDDLWLYELEMAGG